MESKYQNKKESQKICASIFQDTYSKCQSNPVLSQSIQQSINSTKLYLEGNIFNLTNTPIKSKDYNITISPDRTLNAIYKHFLKYNIKGKFGVLNFASAKHPGGGVCTGARSQEESICRASTLYPCLKTQFLEDNYYSYHMTLKKQYSDRIIYIPNVTVFKTDDDIYCKMLDAKFWYNIDIITCAAHNQRAYKLPYEELKKINYNKIKAIIESAVENNVDNLIMGAYGCGAFGNDPQMVSKIFKKILIDEEYFKYFLNVHFAIFTVPHETKNLDQFRETFSKYMKKI